MRFLNAPLWELSKIECTDLFFSFNFQHAFASTGRERSKETEAATTREPARGHSEAEVLYSDDEPLHAQVACQNF